jgi:Domain of unknown function (DUF4129)
MRIAWGACLGLALAALVGTASGQPAEHPTGASLESPVRSVLKQEAYPWYDGEKDQVRAMLPNPSSWSSWLGRKIDAFFDWLGGLFGPREARSSGAVSRTGGLLPTLLFLVAGGLLLVLLWRLWRLYEPAPAAQDRNASVGEAARIAGLLPSASLEGVDPWAEALRHRAAGDGAAAVIWLFLYQLLALERTGRIRLSSGKTARHYVSMIDDTVLADGLRATLGVFEQVYYGHRVPDPAAMESVWSRAEVFRHRLEAIKLGTTG